MSKIILFDPIYSGHHVSYAKSLKMSTKNTILVVNKNKKDLFNDIPSEKK
ncbi:hypothetical protein [Geobacillus zalihae]|nr:hypothetical protein [Geobacillus zalihae]QNU23478.1 hypothetical protein IC806_09940 [Geobacillus zalihae]